MTTHIIANRYKAIRPLGEGAMGLVWLVEDQTSFQQVALKVVSGATKAGDRSNLRLKQEFRLQTQLRHPHCCRVYEYGQLEDGQPYFTMEVVAGYGLDEAMPLQPAPFKHVFGQLLLALGYIHQRGLVHRDLKPANVRVRLDGTVKLMDFGLMEYAGRSGAISGTLAYLAPEVIQRGPIDQRADLYAVGCLAYEMLTGRPPFDAARSHEVIQAHLTSAPVPPSARVEGVHPEHERIVLRLLAKEPTARYQSAFEALVDLGVEPPPGIGGKLLISPLIGREALMETLTSHLGRVARGEPGATLLLSGPPGIGKSRLVEEFRFRVQLESLPGAVGQSHEQRPIPYGPFVSALRSLLPSLGAHVPEELARLGPVLVKLLPELDAAPSPDLDAPNKEKLRLQSAIASLLTALAAKQPFVMALEDWQWADSLSTELLDHLRRNMHGAPILFLLTSREAPEEGDGPMVLSVDDFAPEDTARMVAAMLGTEAVDVAFCRQVHELSGGNPFYIERLLEHLVQEGLLTMREGRWDTEIDLSPQWLPDNLRSLLMANLESLPESARAIAHAGAVIGRAFDLKVLRSACALEDEAFFDGLEALYQQRILLEREDGSLSFAQDQFQQLIDADLTEAERMPLHTAVAEAMAAMIDETPLGQVPLSHVIAIAHHHLQGLLPHAALGFALEAGARSVALYASADAEYFLTTGLALLRESGDDSEAASRMEMDYMRFLGDLWRVHGKPGPAREAYEAAIALAERLGEPRLQGRMWTSLAKAHQMDGRIDEALAATGTAFPLCLAGGDETEAARCLMTSARQQFFKGNTAAALATTEEALQLAQAADAKIFLAEAIAYKGYLFMSTKSDRLQEGIDHLNTAIALATELGDKIGQLNCFNLLGSAQSQQGDYADALVSFLQTERLSYEVGIPDEEFFALANLALVAYRLGLFGQAQRQAEELQTLADARGQAFHLGIAKMLGGSIESGLGGFDAARALLAEALAVAEELKHTYLKSLALQHQMEVLLRQGRLDEARLAGETLQALMKETGSSEHEGEVAALMGELLARQGEHEVARAMLDRALTTAITFHAKGTQVRALKAQAWLGVREGRWEEAAATAEKAQALANAINMRYPAAELEGLRGEIALATGAEGAIDRFGAMEALASEIGNPILLAEARFGQAAAAPYDEGAPALAEEAGRILLEVAEGLEEDSRAALLAIHEVRRVHEGNHVGFSLPLVTKSTKPTQPMAQGMWGMGF